MIDKQANKRLAKGLKTKTRKPSFFARYGRKKLLNKIVEALKEEKVEHLWLHGDFVSAVEKKPKSIVAYVSFVKDAPEGWANTLDGKIDNKVPKYSINIIDVKTLLPAIKESIFKELVQVF
ncbi:MAG: hypothetical protein IJ748_08005 [Bacteroidales bacterium]|nr:hypothetical protein [Bacteroidales bacterium]